MKKTHRNDSIRFFLIILWDSISQIRSLYGHAHVQIVLYSTFM